MKKIYYLFFAFLILTNFAQAQSLYSTFMDSVYKQDDGYIPDRALVEKMNPRKPLWIPALESVGLNLALGAFNTYIGKSEFAKISFKTVEHNHEIGWTTDADGFLTNMWAHPFHGGMYYNFARSSGYNYWTSLGIASFGSWQWEFFMENEPPAFNDWIMTSYGGSMLGEMFYRFSNLIIDESATGWERFWREFGAGVFNPGRLFNRLVYGRTSRVTNEKLYERQPFLGELGLGSNNVANGTDFELAEKSLMVTLDVTYGRLFKLKELKPFDFFRFNAAFNFGNDSIPLFGQFRIYNTLMAKTKPIGNNGSRLLWGIFGHFDYLENNVYQVGGVSVGLGIGYRTPIKNPTQYMGMIHGAVLLMGGANSDYATDYKVSFLDSARTYNMGPGAHAKWENIVRFRWGSITLNYSFWWIHTWDGAPGDEFIGMLQPKIRVRIYDRWYLGLEYLLYHRKGVYDGYDDRSLRNNEQRLFIGYSF